MCCRAFGPGWAHLSQTCSCCSTNIDGWAHSFIVGLMWRRWKRRGNALSCSGFIAYCILLSFGIWMDFTAYEFMMLSVEGGRVSLHGVQKPLHCRISLQEAKRSTSALLTESRWKLFLPLYVIIPLTVAAVETLCVTSVWLLTRNSLLMLAGGG